MKNGTFKRESSNPPSLLPMLNGENGYDFTKFGANSGDSNQQSSEENELVGLG